jgi:hypothetical protein
MCVVYFIYNPAHPCASGRVVVADDDNDVGRCLLSWKHLSNYPCPFA